MLVQLEGSGEEWVDFLPFVEHEGDVWLLEEFQLWVGLEGAA